MKYDQHKKIKFALVGCGRIAKRHSELLGQKQIEGVELIAVCDLIEERARQISDRFNVPHYKDMDEMMKKEPVDVVVVLTPSGLHAEHVIALAKYGKHIMVEKPMALRVDDANQMIRACKESGSRLFVIKQNRFNVPVMKLREALDGGRFGKLVLGTVRVRWSRDQSYYDHDSWRGTWAMDGGVLANQASHHIDMLEWMMGEVESVFAKSITAIVNIEAEDTAVVTLKFKNGALGVIEATTATRPKDLEGSLSILGEAGSVIIGGFAMNKMEVWNFVKPLPGDNEVMKKYSVNPPNVYGFGHQAYYGHVVESIKNGKDHLVNGLEGIKSVRLINAIYQSIDTGKEVYINSQLKKTKLGQR